MGNNEGQPVYCGDGCGSIVGIRLPNGEVVIWKHHHGQKHFTTIKSK